jgi:hypothetical protein
LRSKPCGEFTSRAITSFWRSGIQELNLKFRPASLSFRCWCDRADLVKSEQRELSVAIRERYWLALLAKGEIRLQTIEDVGRINSSLRERRRNLGRELFALLWRALDLYPLTQRA